jgi:hypothetical protein
MIGCDTLRAEYLIYEFMRACVLRSNGTITTLGYRYELRAVLPVRPRYLNIQVGHSRGDGETA